jgi:hypothetical protein
MFGCLMLFQTAWRPWFNSLAVCVVTCGGMFFRKLVGQDMYEYFLKMRKKNAEICTNDLKSKSLEIAIGNNYTDFKASNGYIRCFKSRYNIQFKDLRGEAGSVDTSITNDWFNKIKTILKDYANEDIYNLDEIVLFIELKKVALS